VSEWRTTEAHFRAFKRECERLKRLWGLNDWRLDFSQERLDDNANANISADSIYRTALLRLAVVWSAKDGNGDKHYAPTASGIMDAARHEMTHLLTADLYNIGAKRFVSKDEWMKAVERIARHLDGLLPR